MWIELNGIRRWVESDNDFDKIEIEMKSTQPHYDSAKEYDIIDVCKDYNLNFNRGNIVKYVVRADKKKDTLGDLLKAQDYLNREIEYLRKND